MATYANAKFLISPTYSANEMTQAQFLALDDWIELDLIGSVPALGTTDEFTQYNTVDQDYSDADKSISTGADTTIEVKYNASSAAQLAVDGYAATTYKYPVCVIWDDEISSGSSRTQLFTRCLIGGPAYPTGGRDQTITATYALRQTQREIIIRAAADGTVVSNSVAPVIAGTASNGETLTVTSDGTWLGHTIIWYTYQWQYEGADISGATSSTYVIAESPTSSDEFTCIVTAHNGFSTASQVSNTLTTA